MYSYMCMVAYHIGTLAETCEGCGVGAKPEDGVGGSIPKGNARQLNSSDIL
jgi:hypothetical protein